jgi:Flp pilus assembly protein TadB
VINDLHASNREQTRVKGRETAQLEQKRPNSHRQRRNQESFHCITPKQKQRTEASAQTCHGHGSRCSKASAPAQASAPTCCSHGSKSSSFIAFLFALFVFFVFQILLSFPFFCLVFFIVLPFSPCFSPLFLSVFRLLWVSSLAYPNLFGTKRLGCCCC